MTTPKSHHEFVSQIKGQKAEYLTHWIMDELADYYEGSGVEIREETDLAERLTKCLAQHLAEIDV